ncbi:crotonobetainyl-CoA:carnitine CoA-transferase CaiB-like acyl-CoA transferase [Altererythrobacter atlanticus]|uniref:Succinyl-CoA:(R)-benzylsuccinate CoA-transferase subunit BbsF n=1 Tax=Croceibacterium atlanticum TaxID=1267766 RepID=A0A0F7KPL5_9SPHN|nr:CoA transferase [Croceibacterium atlanticum]AKH41509.1 Succinyl-CoA:(R)-benzylsuccinate CoA-transferase subunit BbsF [Croceibacterium atlanticum]MBB5732971.1 crotonobetainyl-CoA:carnitine CoA-transferase CaiB-like acyl-CoA transferase [Croceibacterium atlanticum]
MSFLAGHRVAALGGMQDRPLARFLASLGAEIGGPVEGASFVIDDLGRDNIGEQPIGAGTIHVSVTPFGSDGPRAHWRGGELVASAMGGALRLTGEPGEKPVKEAGDACTFHADMVAAAGAMAAHFARGTHGAGQHVDVSIQQVAMSRNVNGVLVWQFDKRKLDRAGGCIAYGKAKVRVIWRLADGWCFHALMTGRLGAPANRALSDWMDEAGVDNPMQGVDWLAYNRSTLPAETRAGWEAAMARFFASRTKEEIATEGRRRGINACVVNEPADVIADPHLEARGFFNTPSGLPERFALITQGNAAPAAPAIHSGERPGPLSGVKVLDFAWALVGSITTKTLGDLGAEIVKIETRNRPDLARLDVQVSASSDRSFDDKPWFAHLNTSKRSLTLNLKEPAAYEVLNPLIDWANVVVENFSPGTMAKLGLDYEKLAERNPGIVMVSGSVYGQTGPLAREWGVDGTGGALSGRTFLTGYPDGPPVIPGAVPYGDVIVPFVMAANVAAALQHRRETGRGCHIDASMYEICVQQMRDFIAAAKRGEHPQRMGNTAPGIFFQEVYPAAGEDRWVAISLFSEEDRAKLQAIAGPDVAAWTAQRDDKAIAEQLQAAGIAAGALQDCEDLLEHDPQIAGREALVQLEHAILGQFGHMNTPLRFSRDRFAPFRAPSMGEHSHQVARQICGLEEGVIDRLREQGVFQ